MNKKSPKSLPFFVKAAMLSGKGTFQTRAVPSAEIPSFFMADGPHGLRRQVGSSDHLGINRSLPATCFPTAATIANSWSPELGERIGQALGAEAVEQEVSVILGPGLNIKRSPLCGRNFEYFSEDPVLSGRMAASYVRGIQSKGIAACPKHFAANSQETRRMTNDSIVDIDTLKSIYLTAFEIAVKEGMPWSLMSSYNLINGTYANENPHLLIDVLRHSWGFDGIVVTDWGGANDPVASINNGGGLEMPSPGFDSVAEILKREAEIDATALDSRVEELAVLARRVRPVSQEIDSQALAQEAAEESIVLLKNDSALPLPSATKLAVIGDFAFRPRYQGSGSSQVNPTHLTTPIEALEAAGVNIVGRARGFAGEAHSGLALDVEALEVAEHADTILLYLGLDEASESEGRDRGSLSLPHRQIDLIEKLALANKRIVVVLAGGAPIEMPWLDDCDAVVHGYLGGQEGATAMVRVLTGEVNPSGHLAETYPLAIEDTPTALWYPANGPYSYYKEGPFVGYRYYTTVDRPVLFPFGFGLSYTSFTYSDLEVSDTGVTLMVTNTGDVAGADVVQLYVQGNPAVAEPSWELKGFAKVGLEPGQSSTVIIPFDEYTFRSSVGGKWHVYEGSRMIRVAEDANAPGLVASLHVDGEAAEYFLPDAPNFTSGNVHEVADEEFEAVLGSPLPRPHKGQLEINSPLSEMKDAQSPLARAIYRIYFKRGLEKMDRNGAPDLNLLFQYGMPFRAIAKMSGGLASMEMVHSLLKIVNGHFFRGAAGLLGGYFKNRRLQKQLAHRYEDEVR